MQKRVTVGLATLSLAGALFIANFEGMRTRAYIDPVGIPTICAGSTRSVYIGQKATLKECEERLQEDATYAGKGVRACLAQDVRLTQGQYDALVSFTYNVGAGALCRSTLVKKLNAGDCLGAANEFRRWNRAGGRVLPGLTKRRAAEASLFEEGCDAGLQSELAHVG